MLVVELIIVLLAIFLGARLGGIGIGFAGGLGVLVLAAIGVKPGNIPFDVISIIMAVIAAISAMQVAGGLDYLVHQTEKLLRRNPKYITILAPIVTYFLTIFAGTGNISLATLPVIAEVAKEQGVKPCRPLSTAGIRADCDHRIANLSGSGLHVFRDGRSWHQLPPSALRGHPVHPAGGSGDVLPGHYAVQLQTL
jgi:anaerobic C4-dicarboxylate transporter DcuA